MKKTTLFTLLVLLATSCKREFIELNPLSTVSTDVLYKTDKDFQDAVVGSYNVLQDQYRDFWQFGDLRGGDARNESAPQAPFTRMDNFTLDYNEVVLIASWQKYYRLITRVNTILARIESVDAAVIPGKNRHVGEARFLRAVAYFDLVRIYGDVPMITKLITTEEAYKLSRDRVDKIYDEVIIKDLPDAKSKLPATYSGADVGRATKGAAKALLGRVYLTRKDFVKAEAKLAEVIPMGYSLLKNYNELFDYTKNEHHSEYIFDVEYEEGIGEGSNFTNLFIPNATFISDFYGVKGDRVETASPTEGLFDAYPAADLRKEISVARGITDKTGKYIPLRTSGVQWFTKKYMTPVASTNDSRANWKIIRYADVLLMYAESLNENGKTTEALTYLNQVRNREGVPAFATGTKEETRERIYTERRLEFYLEGHRWFDLVRTGRAYETLKAAGMRPHMTLFPVPLTQIELINDRAIFPQNPGYE
ncbi:MAG: RagB/SusD family nutrient uptake outer membrane protein [Cytophagaceae bacterium]|nr:RagB/SusD family nutrient uptake outer membrane protein [Cytophagaceae bacterium]